MSLEEAEEFGVEAGKFEFGGEASLPPLNWYCILYC